MKTATQIYRCAAVALLFAGPVSAAETLTDLMNPAAEFAQVDFMPSIVPGASADGEIVATAFDDEPTLADEADGVSEKPAATPSEAAAVSDCDCCNCGSACCGCGDPCGCGDGCGCGNGVCWMGTTSMSPWKASVGGVVLNRSQPVPSLLGNVIAGVGNIRATDFSLGTTVGVDAMVARRITDRGGLEARYLGALEWDPRGSLGDLTGNLNIGGINIAGITDIGAGYNSTLHSSELNWRHQQTERFSWLFGGRWIELQDTIDFFVTTGGGTQSLSWNTNNHLYGGQIGADYMFWQSTRRPLTAVASGKAGLYGNQADNDFARRINGVRVGQGGGSDSDVAFVTEAAAWVAYRYSEHITFRGGGQLLYIDEVALGSDQVARSFQGNGGVDNSGYVWYTGGLFAVDYVW